MEINSNIDISRVAFNFREISQSKLEEFISYPHLCIYCHGFLGRAAFAPWNDEERTRRPAPLIDGTQCTEFNLPMSEPSIGRNKRVRNHKFWVQFDVKWTLDREKGITPRVASKIPERLRTPSQPAMPEAFIRRVGDLSRLSMSFH